MVFIVSFFNFLVIFILWLYVLFVGIEFFLLFVGIRFFLYNYGIDVVLFV